MKSYDRFNTSRHTLMKVGSPRPTFTPTQPVWRVISVLVMLVATFCLMFAGPTPADDADKAQPPLPTIDLLIDGTPLIAEVAASGQQRYMGLSFRESLPDSAGMLFVYDAERDLTFTMRNTLIPLSIAFISKDLVINEIHDMNVGPGQLFDSRETAQYALEVNQGWFAENGIEAGAKIVKQ